MNARHLRAAGAVVLTIAASVTLGVQLGGAGEAPPGPLPLSIEPESGPPGTQIFVSSTDCFESTVEMALTAGDATLDFVSATPDEDGAWGDVVTVPEDDELVDGQQLTVSAECIADEDEGGSDVEGDGLQMLAPPQATHRGYETRVFTVRREPTNSTTTTAITATTRPTGTTPTTGPPPTTVPTARPASSRVAEPTYTG